MHVGTASKNVIRTAVIGVALLSTAATAYAGEVKGTLKWSQRVVLSTLVSGNVRDVRVHVGSRVSAGEPMLHLDDRGFKADVARAKAAVVRGKEELDEAQKEVQRGQALFERTVLSVRDLQLLKIDRARAEAQYRAAQAELAQARLNLRYSVVRAPFKAVVLQRLAQPGQAVVTRAHAVPLLVVARADRMVARAAVDLDQIGRLRLGEDVRVSAGGKSYQGKVTGLGMEPVNSKAQPARYEVAVAFGVTADAKLRAGEPATLNLP